MLQRLACGAALVAVVAAGVRIGVSRDGAQDAPARDRITVSAAISLSDAIGEAAAAYASAEGGEVDFNFGASNVLARQIVNGARVDVFISADAAQMDIVERAGLVAPGTRVPLAGNRLALIAPAETDLVTSLQSLLDPRVRRVAIGDPQAVPAGVYARQYLERAGLWGPLQQKMVPTGSVRAALAAVETGAVDAGFVYVTDVRRGRSARLVSEITGPAAPAIVYPMSIINSTAHEQDARAFHAFLRSPEGAAILQRHGFTSMNRL